MDFAWVVDALRRGIRVTRKAWAGDPPMYLYMVTDKKPDGEHIIKMHTGTGQDFEWTPTAEQMLFVDDWEEYVDPKEGIQLRSVTGETIKVTQEDIPVWPEVNADGYSRMRKDSDVLVHDSVYRRKKEPIPGDTPILQFVREMPGSSGVPYVGKPVEEPDLDAETNKAIALVAMNIAENLVELLQNPSVQRILQGQNKDNNK